MPAPASAGIRQAIIAKLKADSALAALVSTRIFPGTIPQSQAKPAVAVRVSMIDRQHDLDGPTGRATISLAMWAVSKLWSDDFAVSEAIRQIWDGYTGTITWSGGTVTVVETVSSDEGDDSYDPTDGTDRHLLITPVQYRIVYREPRPAAL